jgi:hypothetical protein
MLPRCCQCPVCWPLLPKRVVPMRGGLGEPAHGDLARQAREVVAADIALRVRGIGDGPVLTGQDRDRLRGLRDRDGEPAGGCPPSRARAR